MFLTIYITKSMMLTLYIPKTMDWIFYTSMEWIFYPSMELTIYKKTMKLTIYKKTIVCNSLILRFAKRNDNNNCFENSSSMWNNILNILWYFSITLLGIIYLIFYFINIGVNPEDESIIEDINVDETVIDNDNTEIELSEHISHKSNNVIRTKFSESDSEETVSSIQLESNGSESSVSESTGSESRGVKRKRELDETEYEDLTYDEGDNPDSHAYKYRIYSVKDLENISIGNHVKGNSNNSDAPIHPSNGNWIDVNNDLGLNRLFSNKQGTMLEKTDSVDSLIDKYYNNQNSDEE